MIKIKLPSDLKQFVDAEAVKYFKYLKGENTEVSELNKFLYESISVAYPKFLTYKEPNEKFLKEFSKAFTWQGTMISEKEIIIDKDFKDYMRNHQELIGRYSLILGTTHVDRKSTRLNSSH